VRRYAIRQSVPSACRRSAVRRHSSSSSATNGLARQQTTRAFRVCARTRSSAYLPPIQLYSDFAALSSGAICRAASHRAAREFVATLRYSSASMHQPNLRYRSYPRCCRGDVHSQETCMNRLRVVGALARAYGEERGPSAASAALGLEGSGRPQLSTGNNSHGSS